MNGYLHSRLGQDCALETVFKAVKAALTSPEDRAVGLFYTPRVCTFAVMSDGGLHGPPESSLGSNGTFAEAVTAQAYEARLFHPDWEVRWLRQGRAGRLAVLWDRAEAARPDLGDPGSEDWKDIRDNLPQKYLLWGKPVEEKDGWVKLTNARIGTLWAPIAKTPSSNKARAVLKTREYLQTLNHGNVCVVEERLLGLDWDTGDKA